MLLSPGFWCCLVWYGVTNFPKKLGTSKLSGKVPEMMVKFYQTQNVKTYKTLSRNLHMFYRKVRHKWRTPVGNPMVVAPAFLGNYRNRCTDVL